MKSKNPISALLGKSPFKAMQEHMQIVYECVAEVPGLFQALAGDEETILEAQGHTVITGMDLTRSLFAQEETLNPVSVMLWYQVIQWLGDLAGYSEKVGNRLLLLIAR